MQNEIYKKPEEKCNIWLEQNLTPRGTSAIISVIEQMIETRAWKKVRGLTEIVSAGCVKNNKRQCNIFWLDAKC